MLTKSNVARDDRDQQGSNCANKLLFLTMTKSNFTDAIVMQHVYTSLQKVCQFFMATS